MLWNWIFTKLKLMGTKDRSACMLTLFSGTWHCHAIYTHTMYCLFILVGLWSPFISFSNGPVHSHTFNDEVREKVKFDDSLYVFLDQNMAYDIWDIIDSDEIEFKRPTSEMVTHPPFAIWTKLILKNEGSVARHDYFSFCLEADYNWVYVLKDGRIVDEQVTGRMSARSEKKIPSIYAYAPVTIEAGEEKVIYFRTVFNKPVGAEHFSHIYIQPAKPLLDRLFDTYVWHACYAGIMLFFVGFSLFMFGLFRENIFIYFATLTLFFAFYFIHLQGMDSAFISRWFWIHNVTVSYFIVSCLILSIFLFANGYIRMKEKLPRYYNIFLAYTIITISYSHIAQMLGMARKILSSTHNMLLLVWVFLLVIPVVYLTIKKDKEARVLLTSIGILFLGVVLFLLSFDREDPRGTWLHYGFQLGSIAFSGILFYGLFDKISVIRREQRRMTELDKMKSNFFANISHEFRTPLTLMKGPLQEVMDETDDPKTLTLLEMAHRNVDRQLMLVNQLLDLSKLDAGKMELITRQEDFVPFLKGVVYAYQSLANQKDIDLQLTCPEGEVQLYFNRDKMEKILYNLLSNAFKFTSAGGQIVVDLKQKKDHVVVSVSDTGIGIAEKELPHIFDRFFQVDLNRNTDIVGSGIGLALVRELVQLHGGKITVASKEGKGSSFTMTFPMGRDHLPPNAVTELPYTTSYSKSKEIVQPLEHLASTPTISSMTTSTDLPHLLVIEDNADVRAFIRLRLENSFHITEAIDGKQGIEMAVDLLPEIIISDVMMPVKDGYEVCQILKSDIRTSHIPIILLTARADQKDKMEGLETGADDYLTKPFSSEELEMRALNLVRLRQQLKERFADSITLRPKEMATTSLDQAFLENLMAIVEANLGDPQFSVETLTQEIGMSKSNLNRKLRALVNQSTNQFIKSVRLQRAYELIENQTGTVSEIAFQTGFGSDAYFVKCFKEQFGKTPGSLMKSE